MIMFFTYDNGFYILLWILQETNLLFKDELSRIFLMIDLLSF